MQLSTYTEILAKLENDYDLADETFITATELLGYMNAAIDDAEAIVHNLHFEDKYFRTVATVSFVNGTADYSLPADIYGNKILGFFYINGATKYEITRIKDVRDTQDIDTGDDYRYLPINTTASGVKIRIFPTLAETSTNNQIWYIRNMVRLTTSALATNICEVPESVNFIYQHVKKSIAKKMRRQDLVAMEDAELKNQYNLMLDNLKEQVPDNNNLVTMDLRSYYDQSGGWEI
jgi:hypothetical protein